MGWRKKSQRGAKRKRGSSAMRTATTRHKTKSSRSTIVCFFPTNDSSASDIRTYRHPDTPGVCGSNGTIDLQGYPLTSNSSIDGNGPLLIPHRSSEQDPRLEEMRDLEPGWNGYNAPVPSPLAIEYAAQFLRALHCVDYRPVRIGPSVMGGVGITFLSDWLEVFVEIYNNGDIYAMFSDDRDVEKDPQVIPYSDSNGFTDLLHEIGEFLNA